MRQNNFKFIISSLGIPLSSNLPGSTRIFFVIVSITFIVSCSSSKQTNTSHYPGAVPQIQFCSLQGYRNEMVHLMAKYGSDNILRSVNDERCIGMSTVKLAFDDPKSNRQYEELKSMVKQVKGSPPASDYLLELIGTLNVEGNDSKFVVKEIIKVSCANL